MSGKTAVLLLAHGAVERVEDVEPYLKSVLARPVPPKVLAEVKDRYRRIGGGSPLLKYTLEQARGLQSLLDREGAGTFVVRAGFRHWEPSIKDAVRDLVAQKPERLVAVCLTPYYSGWSVGGYYRSLDLALKEAGAAFPVLKVDSWYEEPRFISAHARRLDAALAELPPGCAGDAAVLFTAHSLPLRVLEGGDPYQSQVEAAAQAIGVRAGLRGWQVAWQSQGMTDEPWLGPSAEAVIDSLARKGCRDLVLDPIGFLTDHLETLFDDDILLREHARAAGLRMLRVPALNAAPGLLEALAAVVARTLLGRVA